MSEKCQSRLTEEQVKEVGKMIRSKLSEKLRNRLGKVYIEPSMKNYTLELAIYCSLRDTLNYEVFAKEFSA